MDYVLLVLGFVILVKGADFFVDGASSIAKILKIPSLIIGLTIVAFGTSAPEAAVSISASISGQNGMAIGNVIGSNIFNLLVVVGFTGIIKKLNIEKEIIKKEFPFLILSTCLLLVLIGEGLLLNTKIISISRGNGLVLLMFFSLFVYSTISSALRSRESQIDDLSITCDCSINSALTKEKVSFKPIIKSVILSVIGIIAIIIGGQVVVYCASSIASKFGVGDQIIGLTIVAIGTSLPELVTSIVAAVKGESNLALGNVIGSNIFNILFILGISSLISPISIDPKLITDAIFMLSVTILTYIFSIINKSIGKYKGAILISLYVFYTIYLIFSI